MKYTPKPWTYFMASSSPKSAEIIGGGRIVADVWNRPNNHGVESKSNARIISLAPDMFEVVLKLAKARHESSQAFVKASYDAEITRLFETVEEMAEEE